MVMVMSVRGVIHGDGNVMRHGQSQCMELFMVTATSCDMAKVSVWSCSMAMATLCDLAEVSVWSCSWRWQHRASWLRQRQSARRVAILRRGWHLG